MFSQEQGLPVIFNKNCTHWQNSCQKKSREHSISCPKWLYITSHVANFAWVFSYFIQRDWGYCFFQWKIRMVKLACVNEDFVSTITIYCGERDTGKDCYAHCINLNSKLRWSRPDTSCSQRKWNQHYLSHCCLQKMLSICILNVLTTHASRRTRPPFPPSPFRWT